MRDYKLRHITSDDGTWHWIEGTVDGHPVESERSNYRGITTMRLIIPNTTPARDEILFAVTEYHESTLGFRANVIYRAEGL